MAGFTRDEIRQMAREELGREIDQLRSELVRATTANAEASANAAKALERLSLIVVGDEELRVPGLIADVSGLKDARQATLLERAKLSGVWAVVSVLALGAVRVVWYLVDAAFKHT